VPKKNNIRNYAGRVGVATLLYAVVSFLQYYIISGMSNYHEKGLKILIYYQLFFFIIAVPLSLIIFHRAKYFKKRIFRILIGVIIGFLAAKLAILSEYIEFTSYFITITIHDVIKMVTRHGLVGFLWGMFASGFVCGVIIGFLYIEVIYLLIPCNKQKGQENENKKQNSSVETLP
jgi:hypothetical protein